MKSLKNNHAILDLTYSIYCLSFFVLIFAIDLCNVSGSVFGILSVVFILSMAIWPLFSEGLNGIYASWKKYYLIIIAILFCAFAESAKLIPMVKDYWPAFFFVTHILIVIFLLKKQKIALNHTLILLLILLIPIIFYIAIFSQINNNNDIRYTIAIPLYLLVLSLSLWAGFVSLAKSNHNLLIIFGILLFNISDYIVIYTIVNSNVPSGLEYIVWLTYLLSIWCISCVGKNPIKFLFPN